MNERIWQGHAGDDGSIHALGNGRICAYGQGPDIIQLFGPPYSGPQWGSLVMDMEGTRCRSHREPGAAIWQHELSDASGLLATFTDFAAAGTTAVVRHFACRKPVRMRFATAVKTTRISKDDAARFPQGGGTSRHLLVPRGTPYYAQFPFPDMGHAFLQGVGRVCFQDGEQCVNITVEGEGELMLIGGYDLPTAVSQSEEVRAMGFADLLDRTRKSWNHFSASRRPLAAAEAPLDSVADGVATLIKAQQGESGGVLAGHYYHLAYVRDQYGVSRGLLELGLTTEARAILDYYGAIWQTQGAIHNAQPIGLHSPFHIHEEDRSEITGYLVAQACDWMDATGDDSVVVGLQPMIDWAIDQQLQVLDDGALPFNGDETYVAGGMMPRRYLDQASAEATLLFIASGRRFAAWAIRRNRWTARRRDQVLAALDAAAGAFRRHFLVDGRLVANDPARATRGPRFRHGLCDRCACSEMGAVAWIERDANGNYQCPVCLGKGALPAFERPRLDIASVTLAPCFIGDGPLSPSDVTHQIRRVAERWATSGRLPSQSDATIVNAGTVGYDYGFLLLGLDRVEHPKAGDLARTTLQLLDPTGAWVEYYQDGKPGGTRCRPWESAINLLSCLRHARRTG